MAIYPIIKGQKWDPKHVIPPRASTSEARPTSSGGDLIDFGDDKPSAAKKEAPPSETGPKPPLDPSHKSTAEIQQMLTSTGATAREGPLIDFHNDMKKDLPSSQLKQADTEDSSDEFHDARG
jgi:oxysterol-binding protein-related protein 8